MRNTAKNRLWLIGLRNGINLATAGDEVNLGERNELRLVPELVTEEEDDGHGQEDVVDDKVLGAEGVEESGVALEEDEEDVGGESGVGAVWVESSLEGEDVCANVLSGESPAEADVDEADGSPNHEGGDSREGDKGFEQDTSRGARGNRQEGHAGNNIGEDESSPWNATLVSDAEERRSLLGAAHIHDGTGGDVERGVASGNDGNDNQGVDDMSGSLDSSVIEGNGKRRAGSTASSAEKTGLSVGHEDTDEEHHTDIEL